MVSVQLCNKNEYKASGELTECNLRRKCLRLRPSPSFSITGLNPEKKYQVFLSFVQIGNFRKNRCNTLSNAPPLPFNEPNVEHELGIASGQVYMDEITCFKDLKITNKIEEIGDQIVHLNNCHKYTPVLKIMEVDSQEVEKFSFDEASFRVLSPETVKRTKEKRMADEEDQENQKKRQCHGPVSEVPVQTQTKDAQHQVESQDSPNVERRDSSSMNDQSLISVQLVNKNLYTKTDGLTECRITKYPLYLKPSPVFLVTGLDREKKYRVSLSFKQTENFRKYRNQPLPSKPPLPFNERNFEHSFGIASGEKIMDEPISFEGLKITNKIEAAGGRTIHLNGCHIYTPVLRIMEFDSQATVKFSLDEASFRVVTTTVKRANTDAIHNQPDPQRHDEALLAGTPQGRFQAQGDIHGQVYDQFQVQHAGQFQNQPHFPQFPGHLTQVHEHNNVQLQPAQVRGQFHGQVPQGPAQLPFNAQIHPQHNQSGHLTHFQALSGPFHDYLYSQNQVPEGPAQLLFNAPIHYQHNQLARQQYDQLGHPRAPQVPMYPQFPVQASHAHVPQVPVQPPAQPPFNPNPMIPPYPGFNNPIPQYSYPPMNRPTMPPAQQYPQQFNHPSPHNPNFMPHPQMFPQQFPQRNIHPQYPYNGPQHSYQ